MPSLAYSVPGSLRGVGIIAMSLLPIAVVVISFFLLFRALGRKAEKDNDSREDSQDNHGLGPGRRSAPFPSIRRNKPHPKPGPSTSPPTPRHRPCRICGVPATKRCPRCKSVYYCSSDHTKWASLHSLHCDSMHLTTQHRNLKGLADAQTTLFTQHGAQPFALKDAHSPGQRRTRSRASAR
jgi:hypothetical protein